MSDNEVAQVVAPSVHALEPLQALAFADGNVLRAGVRTGVLICGYCADKKAGGALWVPAPSAESLPALIRGLQRKIATVCGSEKGSLVYKLLSTGERAYGELAGRILREEGFPPVGFAHENDPIDAFFYCGTGRLRMAPATEVAQDAEPAAEITEKTARRKRVLIVDDSKTIRQLLSKILGSDPSLEVLGAAECPSQAEKMIRELRPDVITLDIHMPEMDGVRFLQHYIREFPIPTVMISSISMEEGTHVLQALEIGAVDYIQKPSFEELDKLAPLIIEKVRTAASVKVRSSAGTQISHARLETRSRLNQSLLVAIGASTGGTEALRSVLSRLPSGIPPIVIVQHIPPVFSKAFANRLNDTCPFEVKEAEDGDSVLPDRVLIAPGGLQMAVKKAGSGLQVKVWDGEPVNRHKPSVDVLFNSVAQINARQSVGIIMTGMGKDGAAGLLEMKKAGSRTLAQDEASSVVFGMPKEAIRLGGADKIVGLDQIPQALLGWLSGST